MSFIIESPLTLSSTLPKDWKRLAHPYSLWGRQLAILCVVLGLWCVVNEVVWGFSLVAASLVVAILSVTLVPPYQGDWSWWPARAIVGEYLIVNNRSYYSSVFWRYWWLSKITESIFVVLLGFGLWFAVGWVVIITTIGWLVTRWSQRYQLAQSVSSL